MKARVLLVVLLISAIYVRASKPSGFALWKASTVKQSSEELSHKIDAQKFAWQELGTYDNHLIGISHREGDGSAELHETQTDIMIVDEGNATLTVGGTMVEPKTVKPHEVRGRAIEGGETEEIGPGDIIHIPSNIPHQLKIAPGTRFTYLVVKVDNK